MNENEKTGSLSQSPLRLPCSPARRKKADSVRLFNGTDLTGWVLYMQDSTLNPQEFVVRDSVIALSGPFGYVRTDKAYSNYKLNAQWRWPTARPTAGFSSTSSRTVSGPVLRVPVVERPRRRPVNSGGADCAEYRADSTR